MNKHLRVAILVAAGLAGPAAQAQTADMGPYVVAAVGHSRISFDCGFAFDCEAAGTTTGKVVAGFRFRVFSIEAWCADYGKADVSDAFSGPRNLHVSACGLGGAWQLHFNDSWQGLLRVGGAQVRQSRTGDGRASSYRPTFGLAVTRELSHPVSLELAWDITTSDGNLTGTSVINVLSAGLRAHF